MQRGKAGTGLPGFDRVIDGLRLGDHGDVHHGRAVVLDQRSEIGQGGRDIARGRGGDGRRRIGRCCRVGRAVIRKAAGAAGDRDTEQRGCGGHGDLCSLERRPFQSIRRLSDKH